MKPLSSAFELLELEKEDFNFLVFKSKLMMIVSSEIKKNNWTQKEASEKFDTTQPRISDLKNRKVDKFSVDMLLRMVFKLDLKMDADYTPNDAIDVLRMTLKKAVL